MTAGVDGVVAEDEDVVELIFVIKLWLYCHREKCDLKVEIYQKNDLSFLLSQTRTLNLIFPVNSNSNDVIVGVVYVEFQERRNCR